MTGDMRKQFLLQQVSAYFGLAITDPVVEGIADSEKVNNFLDDGNSLVLAANLESRSDGEVRIHLDNAPSPGQAEDKVLLFFKRRPDVINPENMHKDVFVSSMADNPINALYHSLHKVYSPLLLKDPKWSTEFDPKLQRLITELEKGLGSILRRQDPGNYKDSEAGDIYDSLSLILTPFDETQYWADIANSPKNRGERDKATAFWHTLEPMAKDFDNIETLQLPDVEDILETCYEVLDELWKLEDHIYPQQRMTHLMDIIAHAITRYIQSKLSMLDLWLGKYNEVDTSVTQGINLCDKWVDICTKLTSIYWPNYGPHRWQGTVYAPANAKNVATRLREIHSLRTLHKQLTQLLSHSEQDELKTTESFNSFNNVNAVSFPPSKLSSFCSVPGAIQSIH